MVGLTGARRLLPGTAVAAIVATLSLTAAPAALGASFTVNSSADAPLGGSVSCAGTGTCTLRAAVQAADAAGGQSTIALPAGTYAFGIAAPSGSAGSNADDPASGDLDIDNDTSLTLTGSGARTTLINAGGIDRAFAVHAGASLAISGVTIASGSPAAQSSGNQQGGAIYTDGGLSLTDVDLIANGSLDGGAIFADTGSRLSINGGSFTGNGGTAAGSGTEYGGAIEDASSNPAEIDNATFTQQTAYAGGGDLYATGSGALTISASTFTDTVGDGGGGAIFAAGSGQTTITGSQFSDDSSSYGGAIFTQSSITLSDDIFTDDTATSSSSGAGGGALYMEGASATQSLVEDLFSNDSSSAYGGAIYEDGGALGIAQSSITGSESQDGGALYLAGNSALLEDDTVAGNSAVQGAALYLASPAPLSLINDTIAANNASTAGGGGGIYGAASASAGSGDGIVNTIIADNIGTNCDTPLSSSVVTGYDLDSDATCFGGLSATGLQVRVQPALAPPANNGGKVLTMLEQPGSPTIGAGDSAYCPAADARSVERNPASCDLGAYQSITTGLTVSNTAPISAALGGTFEIKLAVSNAGPGIASNVTVVDQLPSGTTMAGAQPSAGTCSPSGSPVKITCDLGTIAAGAGAGIDLFVSSSAAGTFSDTATATDDQGGSGSAATQTAIIETTAKPTIARAELKQLTRTAITLRGRLDPHGNTVSYFFEYGRTRQFGHLTRVDVTSVAGVRSARVVGLLAGTRYFFRLVATSGSKVAYGSTYSFVTKAGKHHMAKPKKPKKRKRSPASR
jgi:uncharacterized repeat protein (TIGR01451 family)/CSLREA domain-containing protein